MPEIDWLECTLNKERNERSLRMRFWRLLSSVFAMVITPFMAILSAVLPRSHEMIKVSAVPDSVNAWFWPFVNWILTTKLIPDAVIRYAIRLLLADRLTDYVGANVEDQQAYKEAFVQQLRECPKIAVQTSAANDQHYEVPSEYYVRCLGDRLKYSCSLFNPGTTTLEKAEEDMLDLYCQRAGLRDGMRVMDMGCGWGSFSLYAAERYPRSKITGVSNSNTQREFIMARAKKRGLTNLEIVTCDINEYDTETRHDRIVSIEMFEHMKNYEQLLGKCARFLKQDGKLFIHIFVHKEYPYHFLGDGWMAKYFFSGGTMPSDDLMYYFNKDLVVAQHWRVNGKHYGETCRHWLARTDAHEAEIRKIFAETYGKGSEAEWFVKWRLFYYACMELFDYNDGNEWFVGHYLFEKPNQ